MPVSQLESNGIPGEVCVSEDVLNYLAGAYEYTKHKEVELKAMLDSGSNTITSYRLVAREPSSALLEEEEEDGDTQSFKLEPIARECQSRRQDDVLSRAAAATDEGAAQADSSAEKASKSRFRASRSSFQFRRRSSIDDADGIGEFLPS